MRNRYRRAELSCLWGWGEMKCTVCVCIVGGGDGRRWEEAMAAKERGAVAERLCCALLLGSVGMGHRKRSERTV